MARAWKQFMRERTVSRKLLASSKHALDVTASSTRAGILAVFVSACLILIIYTAYTTDSLQMRENARMAHMQHIDYASILNLNNNADILNENNVYKSANIMATTIADNILKLRSAVNVTTAKDHSIFYREARPPDGHYIKGEVLLLHGQAFTSANWLDSQTIQTLAAAGYRVIAVDLPGYGQTAGRTLSAEEKPQLLGALIEALQLHQSVLVSPSMSGAYSLPYVMRHGHKLSAFIPIAPVGAGEFTAEQYAQNLLPTLIVYGERDTSLGVFSASHLRALANGRVVKVPQAGHACYLNNPDVFHTLTLNFIELVRTYAKQRQQNGH